MGLAHEHEIHRRRFGRNLGVGLVLGGFAALIFALTLAKLGDDEPSQAFDHTIRVDQLEAVE